MEIVKEQMPELPPENILAEPMARNTAPCIGLAAAVIQSKYEDAVMLVLPSDHLIKYTEMYVDTLRTAAISFDPPTIVVFLVLIVTTSPCTMFPNLSFGTAAGKWL